MCPSEDEDSTSRSATTSVNCPCSMARRHSSPSVLVLIAIGFALGGIIGAILALPVASIVRDLFRLFFDKVVSEDLVLEPPAEPFATGPPIPTGSAGSPGEAARA